MIKSFLDFLNNPRFIKYFLAIFLSIWVVLFTSSLMTKACVNKDDPNKKITYCNVAIITSLPLQAFSKIRVKLSLEKGIALSGIGKSEAARESFLVAIKNALKDSRIPIADITSEDNPALLYLLDRIGSESKNSDAYVTFMDTLQNYKKDAASFP